MSELPAGPRPPRVQIAIEHHRHRVRFTTGNLPHFLLLQDYYELRLRLIRATILVFRHR